MEKTFYVYAHYRKSDGRIFYIGKGKGDRSQHTYGRSGLWKRIVAKHGFFSRIIAYFSNQECAYSFERAMIDYVGIRNLANLTPGGAGCTGHSTLTRTKMSKAKKGKPPSYLADPKKAHAARAKTAAALRIPVVSSMGETFESGRHAAAFLRENGFPTASAGNIASCVNGKMRSAYKRTWAKDGNAPSSYDEFLDAKKNAKSKIVLRSDGVEFCSASQAAREMHGSQGNISMVCRGERKEAYGYGWSYKCN